MDLLTGQNERFSNGLLALVIVIDQLASKGLTFWPGVLTATAGRAIAQLGSDELRENYLAGIAKGKCLISLAITERAAGANIFHSQTTAVTSGDYLTLNGSKLYASGSEMADRLVVFARHGDSNFTALLIDPQTTGVELSELPMGGREGMRQWDVKFDDVTVPTSEIIGKSGEGLKALFAMTFIERVCAAALSIGITTHATDRATEHAKTRSVFGQTPIGSYQNISHPLANLHAQAEAVRLLTYRAAARFDQELKPGTGRQQLFEADATMAKFLAADLSFQALDRALQIYGGIGFDQREGLIDLFLDVRALQAGPVSQDLALKFIAEHVLGLPKSQ